MRQEDKDKKIVITLCTDIVNCSSKGSIARKHPECYCTLALVADNINLTHGNVLQAALDNRQTSEISAKLAHESLFPIVFVYMLL